MKKYVIGFYFSHDRKKVVLIRKSKPDWQKGKLNGVGGKIENKEQPSNAMVREFFEETGVKTLPNAWEAFCELKFSEGSCICYKSFGDVDKCKTIEEEEIVIVDVNDQFQLHSAIRNLTWMIPMALDEKNYGGGPTNLFATVQID